ncbi:hypothetical protein EMCRGX_G006787 [Ephydatia muelleri]
MGNAKTKKATVADRNDGEECNEARDDQGRSGEGDDNKLGLPCLSEQSKTISFNILLLCTAQNSTKTKSSRTFTARKVPESVAALKLAIQEELHVPVYDQKLSLGCAVMADVESLDFYRLKDGNQITLEYTTTVDVECAFHLMSLLRNAFEFVKNAQSELASGRRISPQFRKQISDTLHVEGIKQCHDQLSTEDENISKDEQHQVQIVENEKVMKQLIGFLNSSSISTLGRPPALCCLENLLYNPYTHKYLSNVDLIGALMKIAERPSSQSVIFEDMDPALCSKLDSDVANEGLEAHKRAKLLLEMVGCNIPLQPPSLNNIVRAKLAAMWCGLEEAMSSQLVSFCLETAIRQHTTTV